MISTLLFAVLASSKHWAVLFAGSNGFRNYRHQSDVYQMYQILISRGFAPERVILMSYDDVAFAQENPFPGKIFNIRKHVNVRPDTKKIDYRQGDVTADNLYRVLTGESDGKHPVLQSTEEDDVFFYYNDHGAQGFLCTPSGKQITAPEFKETIEVMREKKMFKRLFICIEACYSGSVAKHLKGMKGVAVVTAANAIQSSYSHGYDETIQTFRTNEWTNHLMRFVLAHPNSTVGRLFNYTKMLTYGSDVRLYGDKSMFESKIEKFIGEADKVDLNFENAETYESEAKIDQMHADMVFLKERIAHAKTEEDRQIAYSQRIKEIQRRNISRAVLDDIIQPLSGRNAKEMETMKIPKDTKWLCYANTVEAFRQRCGDFTEYELRKLNLFAHVCEDNSEKDIIKRIDKACPIIKWTI